MANRVSRSTKRTSPTPLDLRRLRLSPSQGRLKSREFTVADKDNAVIFLNAVCLPYGTKLENEGAFAAPHKLTAGRHYAVMLNTDVTRRGKLENRRFRAYFCLVQRGDRRQRVQQVFYNEALHRWDWDACGEAR